MLPNQPANILISIKNSKYRHLAERKDRFSALCWAKQDTDDKMSTAVLKVHTPQVMLGSTFSFYKRWTGICGLNTAWCVKLSRSHRMDGWICPFFLTLPCKRAPDRSSFFEWIYVWDLTRPLSFWSHSFVDLDVLWSWRMKFKFICNFEMAAGRICGVVFVSVHDSFCLSCSSLSWRGVTPMYLHFNSSFDRVRLCVIEPSLTPQPTRPTKPHPRPPQ